MLALAGCGSSATGQADQAAACLQNTLDYMVSHGCIGSQMQQFKVSNPVSVICTHQAANQYICTTSDGHAYSVAYDGASLTYQPAP